MKAFQNASQSFRRINPHLVNKNDSRGNMERNTPICINPLGMPDLARFGPRKMNRTEAEFALILEGMKQRGEILRWEYEGITLRWAGVRYTPDFVVFLIAQDLLVGREGERMLRHGVLITKLIEIKGAFIGGNRERGVERFRHARTYWPEFQFELHQKTKQGWNRLY